MSTTFSRSRRVAASMTPANSDAVGGQRRDQGDVDGDASYTVKSCGLQARAGFVRQVVAHEALVTHELANAPAARVQHRAGALATFEDSDAENLQVAAALQHAAYRPASNRNTHELVTAQRRDGPAAARVVAVVPMPVVHEGLRLVERDGADGELH